MLQICKTLTSKVEPANTWNEAKAATVQSISAFNRLNFEQSFFPNLDDDISWNIREIQKSITFSFSVFGMSLLRCRQKRLFLHSIDALLQMLLLSSVARKT